MKRSAIGWIHLLFFVAAFASLAAEVPTPPSPTEWVTDSAGFISEATRRTLDQRLREYESQTGHQLLVWIGRTTGDTPLEDWAAQTFKAWRIGRKGIDDGLVVFVMADDRKIRIEVGYGLEPILPDVRASRIIRDVMAPRIRAGDRNGAIEAGVDQLIATIGGSDGQSSGTPSYGHRRAPRQANPLELAFCGLVALALIIFLITHPSLALLMLSSFFSGRGRGGYYGGGGGGFGNGGGGGGGFSGGGGSSGGGGASGSW